MSNYPGDVLVLALRVPTPGNPSGLGTSFSLSERDTREKKEGRASLV